jgi:putative ATP-dependent endonuclease of OLD family
VWESPEKGIEDVLIGEVPVATLRRFLESAKDRDDYPVDKGTIEDGMSDEDIKKITRAVLKVRKGDNQPYAALLIAECLTEDELPETIVTILDTVHASLSHAAATPPQNGGGEREATEANAV